MQKLSLGLALISVLKAADFNKSIAKFRQNRNDENLKPSFRKRSNRIKFQAKPAPKVSKKSKEELERARLINSMTNWQRHQFAKAEHPKSVAKVRHFAKLQRRPVAKVA